MVFVSVSIYFIRYFDYGIFIFESFDGDGRGGVGYNDGGGNV